MNLPGFKETSFVSREGHLETLSASAKDLIVEIDRSQPTQAEPYIAGRRALLASLFSPSSSPYPEVITNTLNCPDDLKPREATGSAGIIYLLPAGGRQNYGVCDPALVHYHSAYGIFDCQAKGVFEVKAFGGSDRSVYSIVNSFSCR